MEAKKTEIAVFAAKITTLEDKEKKYKATLANLDKARQAQQLRQKIEDLTAKLDSLESHFSNQTEEHLRSATTVVE